MGRHFGFAGLRRACGVTRRRPSAGAIRAPEPRYEPATRVSQLRDGCWQWGESSCVGTLKGDVELHGIDKIDKNQLSASSFLSSCTCPRPISGLNIPVISASRATAGESAIPSELRRRPGPAPEVRSRPPGMAPENDCSHCVVPWPMERGSEFSPLALTCLATAHSSNTLSKGVRRGLTLTHTKNLRIPAGGVSSGRIADVRSLLRRRRWYVGSAK
jgi:hypothetical protein